ncbi:transmembrane protein 65 isoform X2 [Ochlerotatus camptorhynchus]|uniref:transmembrane protein 65 isoform X2 n=1 Tax=Ochlerotatus camptorhynchus TaxID=644619 RepID=UPI0031D7E29D
MSASVSSLTRVSNSVLQQYTRYAAGTMVPAVSAGLSCTERAREVFLCGSVPPQRRGFSSMSSSKSSSSLKKNTCRNGSSRLGSINGHRSILLLSVGVDNSRDYTQAASTLTREQLHDLVYRLNEDERDLLMNTLKQFESNKQKAQFEAETVPVPATRDLMKLGLVNALPFIGFGFLDNFTMIIAGDYIEHTLGLFMCISTMAAAALGNTFSDVIGIGSAFYVEKLAEMSGVRPPKLLPIQLEMKCSRRAANLGRVLGITIGCLLGMCPLYFMNEEPKDADKKGDKAAQKTDAAATAVVVAVAEGK